MRIQKTNGKTASSGSVLVYIMIIATIGMVVLSGLGTFVVSRHKSSQYAATREQSFQIAEAGIYWYRWYLAHKVEGKTVQQKKDFWESGTAAGTGGTPYVVQVNDPEGGILGHYELEVTPPNADSTIVIVKSTGYTLKSPNVKRSIRVRFRQPAWCEYSVVADDFMRFGEGTEVFGMIHSNNGIRFDGLAHNIVSSLVPEYDDPDHCEVDLRWNGHEWVCDFSRNEFGVHTHKNPPPGSGVNDAFRPSEALPVDAVPDRSDVFAAGRRFPAPEKNFNTLVANLKLMKEQADSGGLYLGQEEIEEEVCEMRWRRRTGWVWECENILKPVRGYHITLKTSPAHSLDVSMVLEYNASSYEIVEETTPANYPIPENGIIFVENYAWVQGTLDGDHLTIASADLSPDPILKDIYIEHDILYTDKAGDDANGPDILGLIAQNNISVGLYSDDDLEIDAALLAKEGRVGRNYYTWPTSPVDYVHRDKITVFGSIVTKKRYGFAYTDDTGYDIRNLQFDNNLIYYPPPYFPTGDKYQIDSWEEL